MIKLLIIVPSLINSGLVNVACDIANGVSNNDKFIVDICYLDNKIRNKNRFINSNVNSFKLSFANFFSIKKYDIIHSHGLRPDFLNLLLNILFKKKHISTVHNYIYDDVNNTHGHYISLIVGFFWIRILNSLSFIITLSNHAKFYYISKGIANVKYIYNGRSIERHNFILENSDLIFLNNIKQKYTLIGLHCEITKRKGIVQIIRAISNCILSNTALIVIGKGVEIDNLRSLAIDLNVSDRVFFIGFRDNPYHLIELLDCYVMPSYSEGFGLAMIEAALLGLPIACTDIPIFRELFDQSEVSFFEKDNIDSVVSAIINALSNRDSLSKNSFARAISSYTTDCMIRDYSRVYSDCLND